METSGKTQPVEGAAEVVLELRGVRKVFVAGGRTVQALRDVSLSVRRGRITGLIGPDGAGKTTLMRMAVGLFVPNEGEITVLGFDATHDSLSVQARVGYMPQRFGLYEDLSVQENLELYADLQGVPLTDRAARYEELMRMTGLARFTARLAGKLSGGMKQKLGLACTLVRAPELLLLDEPTVGVDPVSRRELWQIVYRLAQEEDVTVLLSTAYLDEAERCDEVILMHDGEVLGDGPPQKFRDQSRGRTYTVTAPGANKRALQESLSTAEGVVDALIQGDHVRLVMESDAQPEPGKLLPNQKDILIKPVSPRLEDTFVTMLRKRRADGVLPKSPMSPGRSPARSLNGDGSVIDVENVKRRFGDFYAVKGVTFQVNRGEVFGLLGANGAGKSTMFRMLCGLLPATEGRLRVAGLDLRRAAATARARVGYMSQKFALYGNLSVGENLRFFSSAYNLSGERQRERMDWALTQFELTPMADATSLDLPLGHKQRLAMACALMHEPEILFLDEPTSGVDPLGRREFWRRINALAEQRVTVMVTTHFMEEAEYCDRLAIMADGEILALGTPEEIKQREQTAELPEPTMEEAFIALIEGKEQTQ
ncbi:MAG: ATP-binding cassette domain-containing protein [Chthoniobacterales bacterium]